MHLDTAILIATGTTLRFCGESVSEATCRHGDVASEIARRWNAYQGLVEACKMARHASAKTEERPMPHTPEPWVVDTAADDMEIAGPDGRRIGDFDATLREPHECRENAKRAAACVNALVGVQDPSAAKDVLARVVDLVRVVRLGNTVKFTDAMLAIETAIVRCFPQLINSGLHA